MKLAWVLFVFPTLALIFASIWTVADVGMLLYGGWHNDRPNCIFGIVMAASFWIVALIGFRFAMREK